MKNITLITVAAVAALAISGCAPKKSCGTAPVAVKAPVVKVAPVAAPTVKVTPAPVVVPQEVEAIIVPVIDAKESAVR